MPPPPSRRLPQIAGVALDLAALALLVCGLARAWPALPFGAEPAAGLLNGPDAGEWALNALEVVRGDPGAVDPHRMPTFVLLLALAHRVEPDLARAGHALAVGAWALQTAAVYLLGRLAGGRLVGLLAGALLLGCAPLMHAASRFGVDPVLAALLPLALVAVGPIRRWWPFALVAGAFGAMVSATHLSALPYTLPALLLLFWRGVAPPTPAASRWAAMGLYGAGAVLVYGVLEHFFGLIDPGRLASAVSEGITGQGGVRVGDTVRADVALASLASRSDGAIAEAGRLALGPFWWRGLPWVALGGTLVVGVIGPGLGQPRAEGRAAAQAPPARLPRQIRYRLPGGARRSIESAIDRARARLRRPARGTPLDRVLHHLDLRHGLPLLACLAPLPLFAAAGAEPRYSANLLPFVAVLLARGVIGPLRALAGPLSGVTRSPTGWARGGAALLLGLLVATWLVPRALDAQADAIARIPQTDPVATGALSLAQAIGEHFPSTGGVATPLREAAAHLGRPFCPRSSCVSGGRSATIEACVSHLRVECAGSGPIPLVWFTRGPLGMGDDDLSQAVGAWAAERYPVAARLEERAFDAVLISVPRADLPSGHEPPTAAPGSAADRPAAP